MNSAGRDSHVDMVKHENRPLVSLVSGLARRGSRPTMRGPIPNDPNQTYFTIVGYGFGPVRGGTDGHFHTQLWNRALGVLIGYGYEARLLLTGPSPAKRCRFRVRGRHGPPTGPTSTNTMVCMSLIGCRCRLATFQGASSPPEPPRSYDNYWKLIGETGVVIAENDARFPDRVLVRFDTEITALGLACHHRDPAWSNALWIQKGDLTEEDA